MRRSDCTRRVEEMKQIVEDDGRVLSAETEQMRAKINFQVPVRPHLLILCFYDVLV